MKRVVGSMLTLAGLMTCLAATAQDTTTVVTPDQTTVVTDDGSTVDTSVYPTTGWDPSWLMAASGGLAAGAVGLKGFLRRRS